ncbi:hypothetical protein [Cellulosimicrobium cellulans]|uniref:hypothetical protein n=1 Tax=Cellulosimicrobium cellulans TaxID=1710 RepID=UPI001112EBA7|nr:hypothetical protein [Cellulosimicrobium cellulans]
MSAGPTPADAVGRDARPAGWWRTNRWWLVVLVAALAAFGWLTWRTDTVQAWWTTQPHRAHAADADGWARVGHVQVQLGSVAEVGGLDDGLGGSVEAPDGYTLWAAELSFRSDAPPGGDAVEEATGSCTAALRDTDGREYAAGAGGLPGAGFPDPLPCAGSGTATQYFLTPDDAVPAEVRVVEPSLLPDYVALDADAA